MLLLESSGFFVLGVFEDSPKYPSKVDTMRKSPGILRDAWKFYGILGNYWGFQRLLEDPSGFYTPSPLSDVMEPKFSLPSRRLYSNSAPPSTLMPTALRDGRFFVASKRSLPRGDILSRIDFTVFLRGRRREGQFEIFGYYIILGDLG